jgi:DNA excision repair protein ERCC-2
MNQRPDRKLIYCSRTVPEIEKALAELKRLMEYRFVSSSPSLLPRSLTEIDRIHSRDVHHIEEPDFLGLGLTSRKNLCVHETIAKEKKGKAVDARCRDMTNATAKAKHEADPESTELCKWHEVRLGHFILPNFERTTG